VSIFTHTEIQRRVDTLRSNLGDMDAGVFSSFTNSYYMSGVPILPWGRPTITIIPAKGEAVIIAGKADEQNIANNSPFQNVITYGDIEGPNVNEAIRHLADVLQTRGLNRIGIDAFYTPMAYVELLKSRLPTIGISDISDVVDEMRIINSIEEIELIRKATATADFGMKTYLSEAKLGMTEIELAGQATLAMAKFAAATYPDTGMTFNCYSQQGTHSLEPHAAASGQPLKPGQLLCVVVEATAEHYMAAVERAIVLGDLLPDQQNYYDAVIASLQKTISMCAPGVSCSAMDKVSQSIFQKAGYDNFLCGTGLSRGLLNAFEGRLEKSNLRIYNDYLLRPNMVLSIEPYAIAPGVGAQRHCEMVRVTENGNEVLSKAPSGYLKID